MTFLTSHLSFSSSSNTQESLPPPNSHLLISDTLTSPGYFTLYHLVSSAISDKKRILPSINRTELSQVIWVDFRSEGRNNWETILRKLGSSLPSPDSSKGYLFTHIQPTSFTTSSSSLATTTTNPSLFDQTSEPSLKETYDTLKNSLTTSIPSDPLKSSNISNSPLVILDGLTELLWIGFDAPQVGRFVRAVYGLVRKSSGILVSTTHADHIPLIPSSSSITPCPEHELFERLLRITNCWWRISGLSSGRSGNVSGEISSHPILPIPTTDAFHLTTGKHTRSFPDIPRSKPLQYRLESNTVKLFAKGTGRGYL